MGVRHRGVLLALAALAVAVAAAACGGPPGTGESQAPKIAPAPVPHHHATEVDTGVVAPPGSTLVATTHGAIPGSPMPNAPETQLVPASWFGYPSILPVIATRPNWVEVRLAQRPNGSTTWVPLSDVSLSSTPYRMVMDLKTEHLVVYEDGEVLYNFPAGIGTPDDPTTTGHYFVTMKVPPPNAGYGPFVLVTSDHSDTITDWATSGDAIIAIHGPITSYDDQLIGTTGAAISHGCVRLHDSDLALLANIPDGTPLDIITGVS